MSRTSLSQIHQFIEGYSSGKFWIGIDVHKRSYSLALLREDGMSYTWVTTADPIRLVEQLQGLPITISSIVYESGPTGFGLARTLKKANIPVDIAAPSRIPRPVRPGAKSDRLDCLKLAAYGSKGMVKSIAVPREEEEALRALLRRRQQLTESLVRVKQRIKSLLLYIGQTEPHGLRSWTDKSIRQLENMSLNDAYQILLKSLIRQLRFVQDERQIVLNQLQSLISKTDQQNSLGCLSSVPGVGSITALTFLLEVFNPQRFNRAEEIASYLGLAPMVHHSGEQIPPGKLQPVGQACLRSLLIEVAWMWKTKDEGARTMYNNFLSKMGIPQKAICAMARRLAIILWRIAVEQRTYYPIEVKV